MAKVTIFRHVYEEKIAELKSFAQNISAFTLDELKEKVIIPFRLNLRAEIGGEYQEHPGKLINKEVIGEEFGASPKLPLMQKTWESAEASLYGGKPSLEERKLLIANIIEIYEQWDKEARMAITCPWENISIAPIRKGDAHKTSEGRWQMAICPNCDRAMLLWDVERHGTPPVTRVYPQPGLDIEEDQRFPDKVARDFAEARVCLALGAYHAAATMARRCLQAIAYDKGAPEKRLLDQINWLVEQQIITSDVGDLAHQLRLKGNIGAHPDSDGIADIGLKDAEEIVKYTGLILEVVFGIPAKLDEIKPK